MNYHPEGMKCSFKETNSFKKGIKRVQKPYLFDLHSEQTNSL
jgi:hypothetical protein